MVEVIRAARDIRDPAVVSAMLAPDIGHNGWATLTPVNRPELGVRLEMTGPVARSGVGSKWETIDRPMRQDSQAWVGKQLERQSFPVIFEGAQGPTDTEPAPVHQAVNAMLALLFPLPGEFTPPILNVDGPLQGRRGAQQWQLELAEQTGDALRRDSDGYVWQTFYDITLALYVPVETITTTPPASPAAAAVAAAPAPASAANGSGSRTYVVVSGDTLQRIAQRQLGSATRWRDIASLNGLSNPNLLRPGQVLKLP